MATVGEHIRGTYEKICRNLNSLTGQRGLLSQNVLAQLRDLVEGVAVRLHTRSSDEEYNFPVIGRCLAFVKGRASMASCPGSTRQAGLGRRADRLPSATPEPGAIHLPRPGLPATQGLRCPGRRGAPAARREYCACLGQSQHARVGGDRQADRQVIVVDGVQLPAYAPEISPVEGLSSHLKRITGQPQRPQPGRPGPAGEIPAQAHHIPRRPAQRIRRRNRTRTAAAHEHQPFGLSIRRPERCSEER